MEGRHIYLQTCALSDVVCPNSVAIERKYKFDMHSLQLTFC